MDDEEIAKSAALEQRHWWYAERRAMVRRTASRWPAGRALDVGCAGGGNTAVLRELGWSVTGLEYSAAGAEIAASRDLDVVRGDATALPFADARARAAVWNADGLEPLLEAVGGRLV